MHPDFDWSIGKDIGVYVLDEPASGVGHAVLPGRQILDILREPLLDHNLKVTKVGYGGDDWSSWPVGGGIRRFAPASAMEIDPTLMITAPAGPDEGNVVNGDSGGAVFLAKSRVLVGFASAGDASISVWARAESQLACEFFDDFVGSLHCH